MNRQLSHEMHSRPEAPRLARNKSHAAPNDATPTRRAALLSVLAGVLSGCTSQISAFQTEPAPLPAYRLGPNDRVKLTVFGEDRLSGEFKVDTAGRVALPLIGEVDAAGASTTELAELVRDKLAGRYILNPRVSVEIASYRPFFIIGEVNQPGEYPYSAGLTLISAVAQAKGFSMRANKRTALVRRAGSDQTARVEIDPSTPVLPGDVITILERWF